MARTEDARPDTGLQLSSEESRAIIDSIAQPLFAIDRQFRLVTCNRAGEAHIRARMAVRRSQGGTSRVTVRDRQNPDQSDESRADLSGFCYHLLYGRDSVCPYCPAFNDAERVFLHDRPVEKMIQLRDPRRPNGARKDDVEEELNYRLTFSRADSQRIMMLETLEDVTDQNQIQEEALRKENLAALGIMISGTAHELNNPLTGMGLNLQNLQANLESMAPDEIQKRLGILKKDLQQAARIVSDILSFSRPGQLRLTNADILQTVEKAVATTRRLYPVLSRQTDFRIEGENIIFPFDPEKIERLFINLFRNSIQAFDYARGIYSHRRSADSQIRAHHHRRQRRRNSTGQSQEYLYAVFYLESGQPRQRPGFDDLPQHRSRTRRPHSRAIPVGQDALLYFTAAAYGTGERVAARRTSNDRHQSKQYQRLFDPGRGRHRVDPLQH